MPELVQTYERFKQQGFDTVAVAMQYDPPAWVNRFATSRQLPFKVALDHTGNNAKEWGEIRLTPTTFLVDKNGRIVKQFVGPPNFESLHELIDKLLKAPTGA
jgi:peroxiredoxin